MEKKGSLKTILIIVILIALAGAGYFGYTWYQGEKDTLTKAMKVAAEDYFMTYVSANTGASAYDVTLADLKEANENGEEYDLKPLKSCNDKKTIATVSIDFSNGKAKKIDVKLDCGKIFK